MEMTSDAFLCRNNLTITPVYLSESHPIQLSPPNRPMPELLTIKSFIPNDLSSSKNSIARDKLRKLNDALVESTVKSIKHHDGSFRRPRQVFTTHQETELADFVRDTSIYYSGLSSKEVRILAFVYGICNQVDMPMGWYESHQASFDWIVGFIKRSKMPSNMITGISFKGSIKQSKLPSSKANQIMSNANQNNDTITNDRPIEID